MATTASTTTTTTTTTAIHRKERLYAQLASSLARMDSALSQTTRLCHLLQNDLHAVHTLAVHDAAKFMAVATSLNPPTDA